MTPSVILNGARTPIGRLSGALSSFRASELGTVAIVEALRRAGVSAEAVDYVILGQVLQAGQGQATARQAAVAAGIPMRVPAMTLNKVCLSGLNAIHLADLMIRAGEAEIVVAGGMESMTNAPFLLPEARAGYRYGEHAVLDVIQADGLTCAFEHVAMGAATESYAENAGISRERMDELAAASHERAARAEKEGRLGAEIVPVSVPQRRGEALLFEHDEGIRPDTDLASLAGLRPAFSAQGTITAGNASQISDGAAAVVVCSPAVAERLGVQPLAEIVGYGQVAGPDPSLLLQPANAIRDALERSGRSLGELSLFEMNEAFAAVAIASTDELGVDPELVNPNGGAIALGHPIGMSGARVALTLCMELRRRGGGLGAAALCGGSGQGDAALFSVPA
ncbi:MAG TPA: acetyl-CoA C-acetyltransferase [Acidimicrobiales bacterium]|nr:acetyl-CoA C-acetyltransferase [Acidimicrobiales bacterium]